MYGVMDRGRELDTIWSSRDPIKHTVCIAREAGGKRRERSGKGRDIGSLLLYLSNLIKVRATSSGQAFASRLDP
jgi:hypothetical protein